MSKSKKKAIVKAVPGKNFKVELPKKPSVAATLLSDREAAATQAVASIAAEVAQPVTPEEDDLKIPVFLKREGVPPVSHEEARQLARGHVDWAPIKSIEESRAAAKLEDTRRQQAAMVYSVANPKAPVEVSIKDGTGPVTACAKYVDWDDFKTKHDWAKYPLSRVVGEKDLTIVLLKVTPWVYGAAPEGARPVKPGAQPKPSGAAQGAPRAPRAPKADVPPSGYIPNSRLAMAIRAAGFELKGGVPMLFERSGDGSSLVVQPPEKQGGKSSSIWLLRLKGKAEMNGSGHAKLEDTLKKEDK